jgi:hypothetical protein
MGFLAHLAGLARGEAPAGAARVSLPPRFAEASPMAAQTFGEIIDEGRASPVAPASRQASSDAMGRIETPSISGRSWGPEERRDEPGVSMGSRAIPPPSKLAPTQYATRPGETGRSVPAARSLDAGRSPQPAPAPVRSDVSTAPQSRPLRIPAESAPPVNGAPDPGGHRVPMIVAPLSDAVVAARPRAPREERPVIHVTIDRLDVRAPGASKPAAERRKPRPLPSQSLTDYLRGGAGGGQR